MSKQAPLKDGHEVTQQGDDVRAVRYRPSDSKGYLHDVEILFDDGSVITIACEDAAHARTLWGQLNRASHFSRSEAA